MITTDYEGEYLNVYHDGELRVSVSEEHNEILVYEANSEEPVGKFDLIPGSSDYVLSIASLFHVEADSAAEAKQILKEKVGSESHPVTQIETIEVIQ